MKGKKIVQKYGLEDRTEPYKANQPKITMKDHKIGFGSKPTVRLIKCEFPDLQGGMYRDDILFTLYKYSKNQLERLNTFFNRFLTNENAFCLAPRDIHGHQKRSIPGYKKANSALRNQRIYSTPRATAKFSLTSIFLSLHNSTRHFQIDLENQQKRIS